MHSVQTGMWDPRPPSKHASPVPVPSSSNSRLAHVTTATPAKRITFYRSGDNQFGGIRMAIHKRSFKCFDALLDDLSQKVPLPFGVRTVTTPRGIHAIKHLEQLQDGGCYLCSDRRYAKPINMELVSKRPNNPYHHSRRPHRPETSSTTPPGHMSYRQRRILLVKNSEPGMRRSVVLSRRSARSLRAFLDEVSEVMQFHVRKLYTAEGRRIDSVQSLMTCPSVLVCVGREAFSPMLVNFIRKSSEEKLPGLGPRTPGNGARSPATQGARSPPHGAQSRASEYSEGHESKKNGNFGLETKKSIIHPRSDSSNRSTRFSLSSDKSYGNGVSACSQARPAIMNDDIEKRVLVNKDGSLSVEMRVRFRLHNDETLRWSTQIKKSPSLTNDSCPLNQAEPHYLQQGQTESCSDPDSTSFDPERVDYSNQPLQHALDEPLNHCPCCYQRQELQYDLWENPAHSHKHPPVPPPHPHPASHTHTIMRHTHSSSSSSSCNSRRVVRCRAQLSSCRGGSGSEQSQLVQEEMCVTEQVEHRVEVEQDGDTHVEMCKVSRCCSRSEVVAFDSNLRPLSKESMEDELEEEEEERPVSAISSSSHILQSLKEDQDDEDDELPPSASQCCHCSQPSASPTSQVHLNDKPTSLHSMKHADGEKRGSRATSAASSCHCEAVTAHSTAGADNVDQASSPKSKISGASCRSSKVKVPNSEEEGAADDEDEEVKKAISSFYGHTGSQKSGASSLCSICGGCKRGVSSASESRASQKSHCSHPASQNPASPASNQTNGKNGSDNNDSDDSAVSTQSNKTNLTNHGCLTNGLEGRGSSARCKMANPEQAGSEEERAPSATSATSHRSNRSHKSDCSGATGVTTQKEREKSPSALSAQSNLSAKSCKSHKSNCADPAEAPDMKTREEAEGENAEERAISSLSAKSGDSANTNASVKSHYELSSKGVSPTNNTVMEEHGDTNKRAPSSLSVKSNAFATSGSAERQDSNLSAKSAATVKSVTSHRSTCSQCVKAESPGANVAVTKETGQEEGTEVEKRAASAVSAKSNLSVKSNKSHKSTKASERSLSPRSEAERDGEERAASQMSAGSEKSNVSVKSSKSYKSDCNVNETEASQSLNITGEEKENEMAEVETQQRPESVMSGKSEKEKRAASVGSSKCIGKTEVDSVREDTKSRAASVVSSTSAFSAKSQKKTEVDNMVDRTPSAMSGKSHTSTKSTQKSSHTAASPNLNEAEVPSIEAKVKEIQNECHEQVDTMSVKSKCSARSSASHKSNSSKTLKSVSPSHNVVTIKTPEGFDEEGNETKRAPSAASATSKSDNSGTAGVTADADIKVVEDSATKSKDPTDSDGQMLSLRGARSPRTHLPKAPAAPPRSTQSPVQQLLPGGETRGPSALSVHSTTSAKSGKSKCRCGASSAKKDRVGQDKEPANKEDNEELKREEAFEQAASIKSSSSKTQRRDSGGTEQPLSRNSSGSVSLGLPEDQETAESDSGKSSVSFKGRVKCPDVSKSQEESSFKKDGEGTGSIVSQKSNSNDHCPPAVNIPTIETPGESKDEGDEGREQKTIRSASANSAKSSRSSCKCRVKAAAQIPDSKPKEGHASASPAKAANNLETESMKSASVTNPSNPDNHDNRTLSIVSSASPKNANVAATAAGDSANNGTESPSCLRPESAASAQSKQSKGESSVKSDCLSPATCHKSKSNAGSGSGCIKTPSSKKKETPIKTSSKVETYSESTLSHSLSAADLLKETLAAARPRSCQSKASKTSDKVRSEKSARCQRSRKQKDQVEELELTPAFLPNASPNDIVSDWLQSIPANSSMLSLDDELNELEQEKETEEQPAEEVAKEEQVPDEDTLGHEEKTESQEEEEKEGEAECDAAEEENPTPEDPTPVGTASCPNTLLMSGESMPRNWYSSAAVMKVLLSSSMGRCQSMPEVSPVYGRRLSTSARGLLDCLAQLQLIEPAVSPGDVQQKHCNQQYEDIMAILQSLWLAEPRVTEVKEAKDSGAEQVTPPRSSSGVDMSSGSGGSGKENGNQGEDETLPKETESIHEDEGAEKAAEEEEEGNADEGDKENEVEPEETFTEQATTDVVEEPVQSEEQSTVPPSLESPKTTGNPSSSDKSSANDSSKSPTDNEQETLENTSSSTPPTVLRAPLTKRLSQDPDPVWVLHLLKKLEKQFISHYIDAMAEFKVRWDLDDSLILNTMIKELKDEVSRRIQSSIEREMRKIQSRAGKGGRSPRPPQSSNLSRESTMTEKRRRMMKVMKNQSLKTADSVSDEDVMADFSDQRSDDEYCPCDACVRKKMAARPLKTNSMAAEAPVMMEFDLLKILQLKKSPAPAAVLQPVEVEDVEGELNLEVVQEEEEEDETKEDIKADVVLEETIPEENEKTGQDGSEAGEEEEEAGAENEGEGLGIEEQEEGETGGEEVQEEETSENEEQEEDEGEAECQCHKDRNNEESDKAEEGDGETEGEAEETSNAGEDGTAEDEERAEEEEGENAEEESEAEDNGEETGTGEEESDKETVKEAKAGDGEITENRQGEEEGEEAGTTGRDSGGEEEASGETEDDDAAKNGANEESTLVEEFAEGNVSTSAEPNEDDEEGDSHEEEGGETEEQEGQASEVEGASPTQGETPALCVTEGEEADAEDSDTDGKHQSETSEDKSGRESAGTTGDDEEKEEGGNGDKEEVVEDAVEEFKPEEEDEDEVNSNKKEDGALLHQFTRTSVESQPGSLEDIVTDSPQNSIELPKVDSGVSTGGGTGQGSSRSAGRIKRHKPKEI